MLRHPANRKPAFHRRHLSTVSPAASWDCGPQPLQLELSLPPEQRQSTHSTSEKLAGSCVLVINIAGDDEETD